MNILFKYRKWSQRFDTGLLERTLPILFAYDLSP